MIRIYSVTKKEGDVETPKRVQINQPHQRRERLVQIQIHPRERSLIIKNLMDKLRKMAMESSIMRKKIHKINSNS